MERLHSFQRLCRVTAYVFLFIGNLKNSIMKKELILDPEVTINELSYSGCLWLKFGQKELISNKIVNMKSYAFIELYKDQHDLFRSQPRLVEANNLPVLKDSHINKIIILYAHESILHSRVDSTLNGVRSRF